MVSDERLFVYDPDTWGRLGGDSTQFGLNVDSNQIVTTADAASLNGDHYVIWREVNPTATQARVAVYDAGDQTWTALDGGGANGINKNAAGNVEHPRILSHNGLVFAAWTERNPTSSRYQVRVARWNGDRATPSWQFIDGDGADGLNLDVNKDADGAILASWAGRLVVAWSELDGFGAGHIHAAIYDASASSPSWTRIDGSTVAGLNYNAAESAQRPSAAVYGGDLVLSWFETGGGVGHVRVAIYEPGLTPAWRFLDGATANGLNVDPTKDAHSCQVFTTRLRLYCTFVEANASGVQQVRLARFDGNTSTPAWTFDAGLTAQGFNYDTAANASSPHGVGLAERVYLTWTESVGVTKQVRVAGIDGATRLLVGNETVGLNVDPARDALSSRAYTDGINVFALWAEANASSVYQLRFARGN